jgi:hypothetical protein
MTKAKVHRGKSYSEKDLQDALDFLNSDPTANLADASKKFRVNYDTLRRRYLGLCGSRRKSHEAQQLLNHDEELALCDWLEHFSDIGQPLSKQGLILTVQKLCGIRPSKRWYRSFLGRPPELKLGKPSGLDPKRAQAFNRKTVEEHYELLEKLIREKGIPRENVYNMDEKGVQRGGGRKTQQLKYFAPRNKRPKYRLRSANLELVTIIECVGADGKSVKPGFVFPGKEFHSEWFEVDDDIW